MTSSQQPERKNAFQSWVERIVQKLMIALIPLIGARFLCDAQHRWRRQLGRPAASGV
jgi:hypothetical protein